MPSETLEMSTGEEMPAVNPLSAAATSDPLEIDSPIAGHPENSRPATSGETLGMNTRPDGPQEEMPEPKAAATSGDPLEIDSRCAEHPEDSRPTLSSETLEMSTRPDAPNEEQPEPNGPKAVATSGETQEIDSRSAEHPEDSRPAVPSEALRISTRPDGPEDPMPDPNPPSAAATSGDTLETDSRSAEHPEDSRRAMSSETLEIGRGAEPTEDSRPALLSETLEIDSRSAELPEDIRPPMSSETLETGRAAEPTEISRPGTLEIVREPGEQLEDSDTLGTAEESDAPGKELLEINRPSTLEEADARSLAPIEESRPGRSSDHLEMDDKAELRGADPLEDTQTSITPELPVAPGFPENGPAPADTNPLEIRSDLEISTASREVEPADHPSAPEVESEPVPRELAPLELHFERTTDEGPIPESSKTSAPRTELEELADGFEFALPLELDIQFESEAVDARPRPLPVTVEPALDFEWASPTVSVFGGSFSDWEEPRQQPNPSSPDEIEAQLDRAASQPIRSQQIRATEPFEQPMPLPAIDKALPAELSEATPHRRNAIEPEIQKADPPDSPRPLTAEVPHLLEQPQFTDELPSTPEPAQPRPALSEIHRPPVRSKPVAKTAQAKPNPDIEVEVAQGAGPGGGVQSGGGQGGGTTAPNHSIEKAASEEEAAATLQRAGSNSTQTAASLAFSQQAATTQAYQTAQTAATQQREQDQEKAQSARKLEENKESAKSSNPKNEFEQARKFHQQQQQRQRAGAAPQEPKGQQAQRFRQVQKNEEVQEQLESTSQDHTQVACARCGFLLGGSADVNCPICSSEHADKIHQMLTQYRLSSDSWVSAVDTVVASPRAQKVLPEVSQAAVELRYFPKIPKFAQLLRVAKPEEPG